jgi:glutamate N-acetyltransferase/amino-acid N-acetyltransferase
MSKGRKCGADNILTPIDGGVCAPFGFSASGYHCGISAYGTQAVGKGGAFSRDIREDLSLIVANKRCSAACVFTQGGAVGSPVAVSKKHVQSGYARAVFCNAGVANVLQDDGIKSANRICELLGKKLQILKEDVLIASTGHIGVHYPVQNVLNGIDGLVSGLGDTHQHSLSAARGMMTTDTSVKQLSFSFPLGNYVGKIGVIFKGKTQVCPNMATTLCFLTTDVKITSQMLKKALLTATNETMNMLCLDGVSSPNDMVCALANGEAGNYLISCADSEYKQFLRAFCAVFERIAKTIAQDGGQKVFLCSVTGAKSKRIAYTVAKNITSSSAVKTTLSHGESATNAVYSVLFETLENDSVGQAELFLRLDEKEILLAEEGRILPTAYSVGERIADSEEIEIVVKLRDGNYGATAYANI